MVRPIPEQRVGCGADRLDMVNACSGAHLASLVAAPAERVLGEKRSGVSSPSSPVASAVGVLALFTGPGRLSAGEVILPAERGLWHRGSKC